jgi:general secretion pathway protein J
MKRGAAKGFTLVEVLVALTVMAILMTGLFGVLRFGARSWETGSLRAEQAEDLQILHGFLRRRLGAMIVPSQWAEDGAPLVSGRADSLRFVSTLPAEIGMGGLYLFDLHLSDERPGELILNWYVYRPEGVYPPNDPSEQGRLLVGGLKTLTFQYLVTDQETDALVWMPEWRAEFGPPRAIRLDIDFPATDARHWPGLIVTPHSANR